MSPSLEMALRLLDCTPWYLFQVQASGFPRELCGIACDQHREDGKEAMEDCGCLTCHACYSATRDPDRLKQMWDLYPHGLLAVRTGLKSDLFVVDCDRHPNGGDGIKSLWEMKTNPQALPLTVSSYTGGGGIHLFYKHPGEQHTVKSSSSKIMPGIDIKGENSFVILPPSLKAGRDVPYRFADGRRPWEWPVAEIDTLVGSLVISRPEPERTIDVMAVDFSELASEALTQALDRLIMSPPGTSNNHLFRAACRAGEAVYGGVVDLEQVKHLIMDAGRKRGIPTQDIKKTMLSGIRTGMADAQRGYTKNVR